MNNYEYLPDWAIQPTDLSKKSELCNTAPKTCSENKNKITQ